MWVHHAAHLISGSLSHAHPGPQQQPVFQVEAQSLRMTYPHLGTRFLKDAMWKRDKKDFACEMGKLKRLKGQLALMEQDYQTEYEVRGQGCRGTGHQLLPKHVSRDMTRMCS